VSYGGIVTPPRYRKSGIGNPPPTAARAAFLPDSDGLQRPLFSRFQPRLTPGVKRRCAPLNGASWLRPALVAREIAGRRRTAPPNNRWS
jgi:hypothetical protein